MSYGSRSNVQRVREALEERGLAPRVVELDQTARSAAEAAQALGCRVEQIVKSLVFRGGRTGKPVLVLASGPNRVDEASISELVSEPVEKADAAYVREKTGFSVGGVPPVGHAEQPETFVDEDLLDEERGLGFRGPHARGLRARARGSPARDERAGNRRQVSSP